MAEQQPKRRRAWRIVRRIVFVSLGVLVVLAASGALWNTLANHRDRNANPPPGKLYAVNGHQMHLYCTGEGSPTLVLEGGGANGFLFWGTVQPTLSKFTRVCSYDRAGLGWSEPQPGPRDVSHIVEQLHGLLAEAGIAGPIMLMGHSAGGIYIRGYASRFPEQVAGLVFVDASTPQQDQDLPAALRALDAPSRVQIEMFRAMIALGAARAMGMCTDIPPGLEAYAGWWKADMCYSPHVTTIWNEKKNWSRALAEAAKTGPYGDLPVLIFSRDAHKARPANLPAPISDSEWRQGEAIHDRHQEELKQLSTRSRRIIAKDSGHYIQFDRADLLSREVPAFIQQVRANAVSPDRGGAKSQ